MPVEPKRGLEIVGEAASAAAAVEAALRLWPDVVLLKCGCRIGSGVDACREILTAQPRARVIFLTSYAEVLALVSTVLAAPPAFSSRTSRTRPCRGDPCPRAGKP